VAFHDVASDGANRDGRLRDAIDRQWQAGSAQRFPPAGPEPAQEQPKQPVTGAKALIRTSAAAELMPQGKGLEQEIPTRCLRRSGRRPCHDHRSHRLVDCRMATPTSMKLPWRNIGEGQPG
jgi:hypothetical protein